MDILAALRQSVTAIKNWVDENKVQKVDGKGLSTNDYTTADKNKVDNMITQTDVNLLVNEKLEVVNTNSKNIQSLQNTASEHSKNIQSLQNTDSNHSSNIQSLQNTVSTQSNDIKNLQNTMSTKIDASAIPNALKNPNALSINNVSYDGSSAVNITNEVNALIDSKLGVIENGTY